MNVERQVWCLARHNSRRELHSRHLRTRIFILIAAASVLFRATACAQSDLPNADSSSLDFKQWGLLAIQDGGRRKPVDTFPHETLIKITGRSRYTDARGRNCAANDFILSASIDTHNSKDEPMLLVSLGHVIEQL